MARAEQHGDCVTQVQEWYSAARKAQWHDLSEVRQSYRHAELVGDKTVFNIKGNHYRLIIYINYEVLAGKRRLALSHIARLSEYFGLPADVFIDRTGHAGRGRLHRSPDE